MPLPPLRTTRPFDELLGILRAIPAVLILVPTLLLGNLMQTASLLLLPFSRRMFRRFNREMADWWWGLCVRFARLSHGTDIIVTGDELPLRENAVVVMNHQQMADITFMMFLARSKERLGDMKWFVKDIIKYVPGVGWGMLFIDCIFVKRDWASDRQQIQHTFERIINGRVPLWLLSFVEGTRITEEKAAASRLYAEKNGLTPTQHVLIPRTKGFVASVQGLRPHIQAVYDITIGYEKGVPTIWQYIRGAARRAHLHVRRFPIGELPREEQQLSDWLIQLFCEKDRLLTHFYANGTFPMSLKSA